MHRTLSLLAALTFTSFASAAEGPPAIISLTYSGDQKALEALDAEVSAAGTDTTKLGALEARLLGLIRRADLTFTARQAIAQRLGTVLAQSASSARGDTYKALANLLVDDRDSDLARLALDRAAGDSIDALFVAALGKTNGRSRLGIIDTLARRRTTAAVPALIKLLQDSDAPTAAAAARALGEIADPAAVSALRALPEPSSPAVVAAKLVAASRMPPAAAPDFLREIEKNAADPVARAAALRLSLGIETATAAARIAQTLDGTDWTFKQVALEAIAASTAPDLAATLLSKLESWDAPTQSAVIAALARRGEASAVSAIAKATKHADADVRASALGALGVLPGSRDTAALLAQVAAGKNSTDAKLARQSLARLNGPDVNATVLAGAERGETASRTVFIEQLALRNQTEGIPLLLKLRADADSAVRLAALAALGDLAPPSEQRALLDWTLAAKDDAEQSRALRSLVNVTLRNPAATRGRPVYEAIEQGTPDVALRLIPALQRIGGAASAECAARLAVKPEEKTSTAAAAALARWTDGTALPSLATVAEKAALPAARTAAIDATLRYFERNREAWTADSTTLLKRLLASTTDNTPRRQLLALLTRAGDKAALSLAESLVKDTALGDDATYAVAVIRANLAGKPKLRASNPASLSNITDGKTATRWSVPALGEEWVEVAFAASRPLRRITLDQTGRAAEYPEHYELYVTDDPKSPGAAVASGAGQKGNKTVIELPAGTRGRYLVIKNTEERKDAPWAICELYVD